MLYDWQAGTSDDGSSGRGKRRRMSGDMRTDADGRQLAAAIGIDAAWLPLLQQPPSAAMQVLLGMEIWLCQDAAMRTVVSSWLRVLHAKC